MRIVVLNYKKMKIHLILYISFYLFCTSCDTDENQITNTAFDELKKSTIKEFYYNYKHDPVRNLYYKKLMDKFIAHSKKLHTLERKDDILIEIDSLKVVVQKINQHSRWNSELINKEIEKLIDFASTDLQDFKTHLDFTEYIVANELLKASNYDLYKFDKMRIAVFQNPLANTDSIDLIITPIPKLYYNPVIIVNGDTVRPENITDGTAHLKVKKPTNNMLILKGDYKMRQNYNFHHFPIDTILKINN